MRPADRLVLLTAGSQERGAAAADLTSVIHDTSALHPQEAVRTLTGAVLDACHGNLKDDATVLILGWHSNRSRPAEPSRKSTTARVLPGHVCLPP